MIRKLKYPITIIVILIIVLYAIITNKKLQENKYNDIVLKEDLEIDEVIEESETQKEEICNIDIKGAVKKEGVYKINCDNTVNDAIKIAGGLTKEADTSITNLAKKISNEMVIIIYTKEEVKNSNIVDTVVKVVEKECVCPNIQNDSCINTEITDEIENNASNDNENSNNSLININNANLEKLKELPGIGESKAKAIIKYREENGKFNKIDDLLNVDGIGTILYEQIKMYITT